MTRSVPEWIGKNDDTPIPPRVKLRVFDRFDGKCNHCYRDIRGKLHSIYDHVIALANGGSNRESNIQLLCNECDKPKTRLDVAIKSSISRKRTKRLRLGKRRLIPGSKGSGFRKRMDGTVIKMYHMNETKKARLF